jgi:hypothetical protein
MRPIKYALWSMLVIAPLGFTLLLLSGAMFDAPRLTSADMAPMTSVMAIVAFMLTAFIAPCVVEPEGTCLPTWSAAAIVVGFVQLFALLVLYVDPPTAAWSAAYVPGAIVCLNLAALVLVHVWVACERFKLPVAVGLGLGAACAGWVIQAGSAPEFGLFHAVSAITLGGAFIAGIVCALTTKDEAPAAD